jgi:hypothetical protein
VCFLRVGIISIRLVGHVGCVFDVGGVRGGDGDAVPSCVNIGWYQVK